MEDLTWWVLNYRDRIEILAIVIAVITALSSFDDLFVDLYYWCLKLFGRQDEKTGRSRNPSGMQRTFRNGHSRSWCRRGMNVK